MCHNTTKIFPKNKAARLNNSNPEPRLLLFLFKLEQFAETKNPAIAKITGLEIIRLNIDYPKRRSQNEGVGTSLDSQPARTGSLMNGASSGRFLTHIFLESHSSFPPKR